MFILAIFIKSLKFAGCLLGLTDDLLTEEDACFDFEISLEELGLLLSLLLLDSPFFDLDLPLVAELHGLDLDLLVDGRADVDLLDWVVT